MAEAMLDLRREPKDRAYAQLHAHILGVLGGIDDDIAGMATMSCADPSRVRFSVDGLLSRRRARLLRVGPYQGTLGCLEIAFGRGVCGTAAAERRRSIVPDVAALSRTHHLRCAREVGDRGARCSNAEATLIAVLDIDSEQRGALRSAGCDGLEHIVRWFAGHGRG